MNTIKTCMMTLALGSIALCGCKKDDKETTPTPSGNNNNNPKSEYYFKGTIDGAAVEFRHNENGYVNATGKSTNEVVGDYVENQYASFWKMDGSSSFIDTNVVIITFVDVFPDYAPSKTQIDGMFAVGTYDFGIKNGSVRGVVIEYYDQDGKLWSTEENFSAQSTSTFEITSRAEKTTTSTNIKLTGKISCKLFDKYGVDFIELTSGEFTALTGEY